MLASIAPIDGKTYPEKLIAAQRPLFPTVEAYRLLRANIQFSSVDKPVRSLMVTSPSPTEGKSVTLANLAVVMAQSGMRVVAVDADLRRPTLHKIFNLPSSHGLSDAILHVNPPVSEHLQATEVENLWLLASGPLPPNPAELLGSERMRTIIEELRGRVDMVLFDSPPLLAVTDAVILGTRVGGVLLVNDAGRTRRGDARQGVEKFRRVQANVLGVVLNRLSPSRDAYYDRYYHESDGGESEKSHRWLSWLRHRLQSREGLDV
jgi:capsular exopolysaccharide synthesis family protein